MIVRGGTGHASSRLEAYQANLPQNPPLHSKFILKNSSGYFNALKNSGVPENESGEMGPMVMNGYVRSPRELWGSRNIW
jgi:hypothetical protein